MQARLPLAVCAAVLMSAPNAQAADLRVAPMDGLGAIESPSVVAEQPQRIVESSTLPPRAQRRVAPPGVIPENGSRLVARVLGACDGTQGLGDIVGRTPRGQPVYCVKIQFVSSRPIDPDTRSLAVPGDVVQALTLDSTVGHIGSSILEADGSLVGPQDRARWWVENLAGQGKPK